MITIMSPHKKIMMIPPKQPPQTKAQVQHALAQFSVIYESIDTDYGHNIDVRTEDAAKIIFLKRLGGAGADPH